MIIVDENGNELAEYDPTKGELVEFTETVEHPAIEGKEAVGHQVLVADYGIVNGHPAKEYEWVEDEPAVEAKEAWTEEVVKYRYTPYTEEKLAEIEAAKQKAEAQRDFVENGNERLTAVEVSTDDLVLAMAEMMGV